MPLPQPNSRREIHHRVIDMHTYAREDGLFDVEARLVDTKPFAFRRVSTPEPTPAGQSLHDLWIRMTVDQDYVVREILAASDVTPWDLCKQAESTLSTLVGERIARGWSSKVKERLRGAASCTHLMEMLMPMATTAIQGIRGATGGTSTFSASTVASKMDSCFAYGRHRDVVKVLWPEHYRPLESS